MIEDLTSIPWLPSAGVGTILVFAVLAIFRGVWVPRATVDKWLTLLEERLKDKDARIAEKVALAEEYKAAWQTEMAARNVQGEQLGELMEYARTTDQAIRALRVAGTGERGEGSRDPVAP